MWFVFSSSLFHYQKNVLNKLQLCNFASQSWYHRIIHYTCEFWCHFKDHYTFHYINNSYLIHLKMLIEMNKVMFLHALQYKLIWKYCELSYTFYAFYTFSLIWFTLFENKYEEFLFKSMIYLAIITIRLMVYAYWRPSKNHML